MNKKLRSRLKFSAYEAISDINANGLSKIRKPARRETLLCLKIFFSGQDPRSE